MKIFNNIFLLFYFIISILTVLVVMLTLVYVVKDGIAFLVDDYYAGNGSEVKVNQEDNNEYYIGIDAGASNIAFNINKADCSSNNVRIIGENKFVLVDQLKIKEFETETDIDGCKYSLVLSDEDGLEYYASGTLTFDNSNVTNTIVSSEFNKAPSQLYIVFGFCIVMITAYIFNVVNGVKKKMSLIKTLTFFNGEPPKRLW